MSQQNVTYLIDAQDKASAKFKTHQTLIKSLARETQNAQRGLARSAQSIISSSRSELQVIKDKIATVRAYGQTSAKAANESRAALSKLIQQHKTEAASIKEKNALIEKTRSKTGQVASLTGALGAGMGGAFGGAASEAGGLIGQLDAITESLNEGGAAAKFLKVGLAAATAVMAFKLGTAIGDIIFQTKAWKRANVAALAAMSKDTQRVISQLNRAQASRMAFANATIDTGQRESKLAEMLEVVSNEADGAAKNVRALKASVADMENSWDIRISQEAVDTEKGLLEAAEATLDARRQQKQQLEDMISPAAKELKLAQEKFEAQRQSTGQIEAINRQLQLAKATGDERLRLELKFSGVLESEIESTLKMRQEIDAIAAAEKAREKAKTEAVEAERNRQREITKAEADAASKQKRAADDRAREQKRHADFQTKTLDSLKAQILEYTKGKAAAEAFRLEQGSFTKAEAQSIARLAEKIQKLQKAKTASGKATTNNAKDERLVSGRAAASFKKTAAEAEAQRQTKIQSELRDAANKLVAIEENREPIAVTQFGN